MEYTDYNPPKKRSDKHLHMLRPPTRHIHLASKNHLTNCAILYYYSIVNTSQHTHVPLTISLSFFVHTFGIFRCFDYISKWMPCEICEFLAKMNKHWEKISNRIGRMNEEMYTIQHRHSTLIHSFMRSTLFLTTHSMALHVLSMLDIINGVC